MSTLVRPCWGVSLKVRRVQSEEEQRYQISRTVGSIVWAGKILHRGMAVFCFSVQFLPRLVGALCWKMWKNIP